MAFSRVSASSLTEYLDYQLRAIASLDLFSSTAAAFENETATLNYIQHSRALIDQLCETWEGQILASMGDGLVIAFPNVAQALACMIQFQQQLATQQATDRTARPLSYRVSIHVVEVHTLDKLNAKGRLIADKLQQLAEPGGICLSRIAYDSVHNKFNFTLHNAGLHQIKGLSHSFRLYKIPPTAFAQNALPLPQTSAQNSAQLMAVVFTAIDDYEAKLLENESLLQECAQRDFQVITQRYRSFNRRIIKTTGYGLLIVFPSAAQAVSWAMHIQHLLQKQAESLAPEKVLQHKIAIHLGDVELIDQDIAGNTVNMAARLVNHTPIGGICLSSAVYDCVESIMSLPITVVEGKLVEAKGIPHPLRVYPLAELAVKGWKARSLTKQPRKVPSASTPTLSNPLESLPCATASVLLQAYQQGHRNFSGQGLKRFNLSQAELPKINLSNCWLDEIDLRGANLTQADFSRSELRRANLFQANLTEIYGNYANFEGANLQGAELRNAHLSNANFQGADLRGANLMGAQISSVQLSRSLVDHTTIYPDGKARTHSLLLKSVWQSLSRRLS